MKKIALYTKHPYCSLDGCNGIMESLYPYYKFKLFNERHIEEEFFDDVDMIMFPGGVGDSDKFDRFFASTDKDKKRGLFHYDSSIFPYIATAIVKGKWNYSEYKNELDILFDNYKINKHERGIT